MNFLNLLMTKAYVGVVTAIPAQVSTPTTTVPIGAGSQNKEEIRKAVTETDLWKNIVVPISFAIGILVVVFGAYKTITQFLKAKPQDVFRTLAGTIIVAAILFNLGLVFDIIGLAGQIVTSLVSSVTQLISPS